MTSKLIKALELFGTLSIEEQEKLILIETKKNVEMKKKILSNDIGEAIEDIKAGNFITGNYEQVMKAIDDEIKSDKQIQKRIRKANQKKSLTKK